MSLIIYIILVLIIIILFDYFDPDLDFTSKKDILLWYNYKNTRKYLILFDYEKFKNSY